MEYTSEQYRLLEDPGHFFRDFTVEEMIDWLYIDEYSLVSEEPNFLVDVMETLGRLELYDLAEAVKQHIKERKLSISN